MAVRARGISPEKTQLWIKFFPQGKDGSQKVPKNSNLNERKITKIYQI